MESPEPGELRTSLVAADPSSRDYPNITQDELDRAVKSLAITVTKNADGTQEGDYTKTIKLLGDVTIHFKYDPSNQTLTATVTKKPSTVTNQRVLDSLQKAIDDAKMQEQMQEEQCLLSGVSNCVVTASFGDYLGQELDAMVGLP